MRAKREVQRKTYNDWIQNTKNKGNSNKALGTRGNKKTPEMKLEKVANSNNKAVRKAMLAEHSNNFTNK